MPELENKKTLVSIIKQCPEMIETISACQQYGLPNFYLAGGSVTQLLWNHLLKLPPLSNIKDFDIVYYSSSEDIDLAKNHSREITQMVSHNIQLDITNQAYVHQWYAQKFGNPIAAFGKTEDGIKTWLSAFAIGVRRQDEAQDDLIIYAPYTLSDAFTMMIRPNKKTMSQNSYNDLAKSYQRRWPEVEVLPW